MSQFSFKRSALDSCDTTSCVQLDGSRGGGIPESLHKGGIDHMVGPVAASKGSRDAAHALHSTCSGGPSSSTMRVMNPSYALPGQI